ncbi:MAG: cupin domain-containing protein [Pseudomonadota bacterium]
MINVIDLKTTVLDIRTDFSITPREKKPGGMQRIDGLTLGYVETAHGFPHNGEQHPDGDELLILISGRLRITADSQETSSDLHPGQACIVPKGEWHKVHVLEPSTFIFATPGPNGEYRRLSDSEMKAWQANVASTNQNQEETLNEQ